MSKLQQFIEKAKSDLAKKFIFVHVKDHELRAAIDGVEELQREHAAMKEVLEFYAAESTYDIDHLSKHGFMIIDRDDGKKARNALSTLTKEATR